MSKTSNGKTQVCYLRCKLYADCGPEKLCSRHSIRLDRLIELVSERLRPYIRGCCRPEELELHQEEDPRQKALYLERRSLRSQLEKHESALRSLYLDKVSGILTGEQFLGMNQSFLREKDRLERRLEQLGAELEALGRPQGREELTDRVRELLRLDTLPRELAAALIRRIEVGERDPDTGEQHIRICWRF